MRLMIFISFLFLFLETSYAQTGLPTTVNAEFSLSLGYNLCPQSSALPPLEDANLCSGDYPGFENVKLDLVNAPAADPTWTLYSGKHQIQYEFDDILVTAELLISWLKANGKVYAYIEGRLVNNKNIRPTYFTVSAEGGFSALNYVTTRGIPIEYKWDKYKADFISRLTVGPKQ